MTGLEELANRVTESITSRQKRDNVAPRYLLEPAEGQKSKMKETILDGHFPMDTSEWGRALGCFKEEELVPTHETYLDECLFNCGVQKEKKASSCEVLRNLVTQLLDKERCEADIVPIPEQPCVQTATTAATATGTGTTININTAATGTAPATALPTPYLPDAAMTDATTGQVVASAKP